MKKLILLLSVISLNACAGVPATTQAMGVAIGGVLASQAIGTYGAKANTEANTKQLETLKGMQK